MSDLNYFRPDWIEPSEDHIRVDLCIYGGSSAGLIAAIQASQLGKSVLLLQPGKFIGGLTTGGLGFTDYGQKKVIGGMSRDFYRRLGREYGIEEEFQFWPSTAAKVYGDLIRENHFQIRMAAYLDKVHKTNCTIESITLLGGLKVSARIFMDATYEGDLLAKAGVKFIVGREANSVYNETLSGIQVRQYHQFSSPVCPFIKEGDETSGLLPGIIDDDLTQKIGQGDNRVQAYNFRMCMTNDPALKIDWECPKDYDPLWHQITGRWLRGEKDKYNDLARPPEHTGKSGPQKFDVLPHKTPGGFGKTDTNNHGPASSDFIGQNWNWAEGSYQERETIFQQHVTYQKGHYWFVANDPMVPQKYRDLYRQWGLPSDEFRQTGNWPHQLYVREARRMISDHVISEADCTGKFRADDSVAMGSYGMDSHNCTRFVKRENGKAKVMNEGDVQVGAVAYPISYKCIRPRSAECGNLLVPVCLSSSHIAYGSARMEPVFMALGQSAAIAACLAIDGKMTVQDVGYDKLGPKLEAAGQVLFAEAGKATH